MANWLGKYWAGMKAVPMGRVDNVFALMMVATAYVTAAKDAGFWSHAWLIVGVGIMSLRLVARWHSDL